ncbi:MAG: hypothetical protein LBR65_01415 [Culturomica sp.]|jgi:hypothetical protein|nr:hypothetical protein [Culturomica sp.]
MAVYELIAFYRETEEETAGCARLWADFFQLDIRYEKLPEVESSVGMFVTEHTVLCLISREFLSFRKALKYVYRLSKPVLLCGSACKPKSLLKFTVPVGYALENKEKALWVNFFQRRNPQVDVALVAPLEKDPWIAQRVEGNVGFIERVLENSGGNFRRSSFAGTFKRLLTGLFREPENGTVFLMRPFRLCSWVIPQNLRVCSRYPHTSTVIIPRDESLYIPCH